MQITKHQLEDRIEYRNEAGETHKTDGPAMVWPYGREEWFINDKLHRTNGPARIWGDGEEEWWIDGKLHRIDGPAIIRADGYKAWYINDKRHREDGPARIWPDGREEWRVNNIKITEQVNQFFKDHNVKCYDELSTELKVLFKMTVICQN